jgi:quinol monooxygenase YgiN
MAYMHVRATVDDFDRWRADFESYHDRRAEHGGRSFQLFRSTDDPNEVVVLIEFDSEEDARAWNDYLDSAGELTEPEMSEVDISYLDVVERETFSAA